MTREEIIQGLEFTIPMFLFDPSTGETFAEPRNDMDKTTIDACKGAIEMLKREPCEDAISRQAAIDALDKRFDSAPMEQTTEILLLRKDLRELPSVQPEKRTETHTCDCISRQAAIEVAKQYWYKPDIAGALAELPPVQPEQRWIPVSERLPDKSMNYVIFTLYNPAWHDVTDELPEEDRVFPEETKVVCGRVAVYSNGNRYWCWEDEYGEAAIKNEHIKEYTGKETFITAWMPMPEPYKPQESEVDE